jgi:hypothetical protein
MSDPITQPAVEGDVGPPDDDFNAQLEALFADDASAADDTDSGGQGDVEDPPGTEDDAAVVDAPADVEGQQPPAEEPPAEGPRRVAVLDREFDEHDARALVEFYDWVRQNPQQAMAIDSYLRGEAQLVPQGYQQSQPQQAPQQQQAPPEPEHDDLEDLDPALRDRLRRIDELEQRIQQYEQVSVQERQAQYQQQVAAAVQRGGQSAQQKYGLTEEEAQELLGEAAALNIVGPLAAQRGDPVVAVEEALEIAYWRSPKFREHALTKMAQQEAESAKRQRKASALSGGSGSVPRNQGAPSNPTDRRSAMVNEISQALNGSQDQ